MKQQVLSIAMNHVKNEQKNVDSAEDKRENTCGPQQVNICCCLQLLHIAHLIAAINCTS